VGRVDGKVVLVTGGARGQGAAEARLFANEGARVLVTDVREELGRSVVDRIGDDASYCHLDVSDEHSWGAAVAHAIDRFGALDVLVNNAGILVAGSIEQMAVEEYMRVVQVNQLGCWLGMKSVVAPMRTAGGGSIVNTSSIAGMTGYANMSAYAATKWAIRGMTRCAAAELGDAGIRVNSIHPGAVDTEMGVGGPSLTRAEKDALYAHQPVPRVGRPEEIASLALFLASDEAAYITGTEFLIDGGSLAAPSAIAVQPT